MKLYIQSSHFPNLAQTIRLIREYTQESIADVKSNLNAGLPLAFYDVYEDEEKRENFLQLIHDLESSGCTLAFYETDDFGETRIDKQMLLNHFDLSDEISRQIDRENELMSTEIIAAIDITDDSEHGSKLLFNDESKAYYLFGYSSELIDLIRQGKNQTSITYYQRNLGDPDLNNWDEVATQDIIDLMGM